MFSVCEEAAVFPKSSSVRQWWISGASEACWTDLQKTAGLWSSHKKAAAFGWWRGYQWWTLFRRVPWPWLSSASCSGQSWPLHNGWGGWLWSKHGKYLVMLSYEVKKVKFVYIKLESIYFLNMFYEKKIALINCWILFILFWFKLHASKWLK